MNTGIWPIVPLVRLDERSLENISSNSFHNHIVAYKQTIATLTWLKTPKPYTLSNRTNVMDKNIL